MIVATAGHVDHGKTSLVRQLTGVETDRLEEEKRRGLSINLGYAYLPVAGAGQAGKKIGFIDVPGHSRFINTMISGIGGIDLALLVVAANDGPMPQTLEHIHVLRLLGVKRYAIVLTHIDTVDQAALEQVGNTVTSLLANHGQTQEVPVFPVNNLDGSGIEQLADYLQRLAVGYEKPHTSGYFRLSIDRSFLLKGAGLIITGTALSGSVSTEDSLVLLPDKTTVRVRNIHADDEPTTTASAGQRCALNIVGNISKAQINRGDWLVSSNAGGTTSRVNTRVNLLQEAPFGLKHLSPVKVYIGAARLSAKLFLLEQESAGSTKLAPGDSQLAQLILNGETSCCHGDRFLLRDDSESTLLGGGMVIDPWGARTGKSKPDRLSYLAALEDSSFSRTLERLLIERQEVVNLTLLAQARNLTMEEALEVLAGCDAGAQTFNWQSQDIEYCVSHEQFDALEKRLLEQISDWHSNHPQEKGMPAKLSAELVPEKAKAPMLLPVTSGLVKKGSVTLAGGLLCEAGHRVKLGGAEARHWERIASCLASHGKNIPTLGDLGTELKLAPTVLLSSLRSAAAADQLYQIGERRFALPALMREFASSVNKLASIKGEFSVIEYRDDLAIGRNQAVELLEYFDKMKFTRRIDNSRVIVDPDFPNRYV